MSKKIMLINATDTEEIRVAILNDGVLSGFDIEFIHNEKIKGNIYKARIIRVDTSLQAAFVHYGGQKNGFLPIGELPRDLVSPDGRRGRIQDLLQKDQEIMIQVIREELGTKGAMVTAQISLPGRYLVLTPGNAINGISRKIESREEREYFKQLVDALDVPRDMGVIVRTASLGVTREDFERDLDNLIDTYKEVQSLYKKREGVGLVWQEDDVVTRTLRDTWTPDIEEIHIDDQDTFQTAQSFFRRAMPQHLKVLHQYNGKKPIFSKFQTEEQIERIYYRRVPLPSGGAIIIDQTEALVAIDVNSGKTTGDNQEDMALRTNMEAAEAIATQLRLRDLAGLIVIDFIDMRRETNNKAVMDRLVERLRMDKARMEVGKINRFGVLVMTRQRIRPSIQHVTYETCHVCQGTGKVKNSEALVLSVLRRLKSVLSKNGVSKIQLRLSPPIAINLLNQRRSELADLEESHSAAIVVTPDHEIIYGEISMEIARRDDEPEQGKRPEAETAEEHGRKRDNEHETVVLDGDAPISFDKALTQANEKNQGQNGRRDAQRAALNERERLRSLFETKTPKTKATPAKGNAVKEKPDRRKEEMPEPPKLTPEVIASLAVPAAKTRKLLSTASKDAPLPKTRADQRADKARKGSKIRTAAKTGPAPKTKGVESGPAKTAKAIESTKTAKTAKQDKATKTTRTTKTASGALATKAALVAKTPQAPPAAKVASKAKIASKTTAAAKAARMPEATKTTKTANVAKTAGGPAKQKSAVKSGTASTRQTPEKPKKSKPEAPIKPIRQTSAPKKSRTQK